MQKIESWETGNENAKGEFCEVKWEMRTKEERGIVLNIPCSHSAGQH